MKKLASVLVALSVLAMAAPIAGAVDVGVIVGEPTGLSLQFGGRGDNALNLATGWSLSEEEWLYVHADYVFLTLVHTDELDEGIPFYYGFGGRVVILDDDSRVGARLPLGLQYETGDMPLTFFIEVAPILDLVPDTEFGVAGGLGVRFAL